MKGRRGAEPQRGRGGSYCQRWRLGAPPGRRAGERDRVGVQISAGRAPPLAGAPSRPSLPRARCSEHTPALPPPALRASCGLGLDHFLRPLNSSSSRAASPGRPPARGSVTASSSPTPPVPTVDDTRFPEPRSPRVQLRPRGAAASPATQGPPGERATNELDRLEQRGWGRGG